MTRSFKYSRAKCYEELLQVEFGILREGNLNPHRRLEVIYVNVERGQCIIVLATETVTVFDKSMLIHAGGAIRTKNQRYFRRVPSLHGDVHFSQYGTRNGKLSIDIGFWRRILKIDRSILTVLLFT